MNTDEIKEKYWNSKPKKKVTGEGIVVTITEKELDELRTDTLKEVMEEVKKKTKELEAYDPDDLFLEGEIQAYAQVLTLITNKLDNK